MLYCLLMQTTHCFFIDFQTTFKVWKVRITLKIKISAYFNLKTLYIILFLIFIKNNFLKIIFFYFNIFLNNKNFKPHHYHTLNYSFETRLGH